MSPLSALAVLQGRRGGALLGRLVVRLLRGLKIKVSAQAVLVSGASLAGIALIGTAWSRNRKDGGAPLWPLVLPSLAMAALIFTGLARATPPTVDMSATESGDGAMAMAAQTPAPVDPLDALRYALASGNDEGISGAFAMASGMGKDALPLLDVMQAALTREGPEGERRLLHFLQILPPERHAATLLMLSLQGSRPVRLASWCWLSARQGDVASLERLGNFFDTAGGLAEDEPLLRRAAACAQGLQPAGRILMIPHLRGLLEKMSRPPHTKEDAWSPSHGYGDPLASLPLWREAFRALYSIAPEESTKTFAWNLLEGAPSRTREPRRSALSDVAMDWATRRRSP